MSDGKKSSAPKRSVHLLNIKAKKRALERIRFSFQRVAAKLTILKNTRELDVSILLLDISESGCSIYTSEKLDKGTLVELLVTEPKLLKIKAASVWTSPAHSMLDSSSAKLPHRSSLQFIYDNESEKELVRDFTSRLKENILDSYSKHSLPRTVGGVPENFVGPTAASPEAVVAPAAQPGPMPAADPTTAATIPTAAVTEPVVAVVGAGDGSTPPVPAVATTPELTNIASPVPSPPSAETIPSTETSSTGSVTTTPEEQDVKKAA